MAFFGGKKKKQGMSELIHESVPQTALDVFAKNTKFALKNSNEPLYAGLLLDASEIGGLSKKDARDEAKGSMVQLMNTGRINVYAKADMLEDNKLVIIPNATTLDAMGEYGLLVKAGYEWVLVKQDGGVILTGVKTSYDTAVKIIEDSLLIDSFVGEQTVEQVLHEEEELFDESGNPVDEVEEELPVWEEDDEDLEIIEDLEDEEDIEDVEIEDQEVEYIEIDDEDESDYDDYEDEPIYEDDEDYDEVYDDEGEEIEPEVITDEEVEATLIRRFYSEELGLEVDPTPFDLMFIHENPYVPFETGRESNWLNDYLNEMSRAANIEMDRTRKQNLYLLRERYLTLMNLHCERIERDLSLSDSNSQYAKIQDGLHQAKADDMANVSRDVSLRKQEIEKEWNDRLHQIGEDAARLARRQYEDRYGRSHREALYRVEPEIRENIEHRVLQSKRDLLDRRRQEAAKLLDLGINETLKELSDMYAEMVEAERHRYGELQAEMNHFIDAHRKDDIARAQALQEELDQKSKADKVTEELTAKIRQMSAEFEAKVLEGKQEISLLQQANERVLAEQKAESESRVKELNDQLNKVSQERDTLMEKYMKLDETRASEYEGRINSLKQDKASVEDRLEHVVKTHKTGNRIATIALAIALVAAIAIGLIGGYYLGQRGAMDVNRAVYEQYQEAIEKQILPETPGN